jgi:hypothetical protein
MTLKHERSYRKDTRVTLVVMESSNDEDLLLLSVIRRRRKRRRFWIRPLLESVERNGAHRVLSLELAQHPNKFAGYYWMSKHTFEDLLSLVSPAIEKEDTNYQCDLSC